MDRGFRALLILLAGGLCGGVPALWAAPPPAPGPTLRPMLPAGPGLPGLPGGGPMVVPGGGRMRAAILEAREGEPPDAPGVAARLARMSPEEREAFRRNLQIWQQMPREERQALREQFNRRKREEVQSALKESGLNLTDDQREVFALRYMQERRRLERDIQEQANAERARRMPEIVRQLKHEFAPEKAAGMPAAGGSPASH